ncbi:MAG: DUF4398 domain-containing protein [Granulosicoccus sp.]|nr:DUF4398 domain-containing protein [Granulosicoccus sp.]
MNNKKLLLASVIFATVSLNACGSKVPKPTSENALADSALKSAEAAGAREYAPLELRVAREKKEAADKALTEKNYDRARQLMLQALADAELARVTAETQKKRQALKEAHDNIEMIRKEVRRTSTGQ